jgi:hypothetical protein
LDEAFGKQAAIVGVEIGVGRGGTSSVLLSKNSNLMLHMVDTWELLPPNPAFPHVTKDVLIGCREQAIQATEFAGARRNIIHTTSRRASALFKDSSIDFVFIDGDHSLNHVSFDLLLWFPKVRPGGLVTGHDYNLASVKKPVNEFAKINGFDLVSAYRVWSFVKSRDIFM